ncbi:hypothetical protein [Paraburkholderia sp. GAS82]|uniref:hypothetical protein n=1 Tax=Paraburkholderia sp. GAS82 TaxID=3035137 RepID=UPI003D1C4CEA
MKNSGFVRKPGKTYATLVRTSTLKRAGPIRSRRKRPTVAEGSRFIDACRGEECYLRVPGVCCSVGWAHPSVVDCHSNQSKHGKGGALKAKHEFTVPGCAACHQWLDFGPAPRDEKVLVFDAALALWLPVRARKMGLPTPEAA